jgi:hypothetical protein
MTFFKSYTHALLVGALIIACLCPTSAKAEEFIEKFVRFSTASDRPNTLEQRLDQAIGAFKDNDYITLAVENDMFGSEDDRYYTSGVRMSYFSVGSDMPKIAEIIDDAIPTFDIDDKTSLFFSLGQNLYTPSSLALETPQIGDRPWAAWLYGSMGLLSITDNHIDEVEASLGVIGPPALGKQSQRFIHKLWDIQDPRGWKNQLKTEPGVMLSWERRHPGVFSIESNDLWLDVSHSHGVTLGNVYTHANAGVSFQLGPEFQRWQDMPMRVRPSMPGTGFFAPVNSKTRLGWIVFGGAEGRVVARNIFLDGNTFRSDSPSVDKEPFVYDLNLGAAVTYGPARVSYTMVRRSKEFKTQEDPSYFGGLSLTFQF